MRDARFWSRISISAAVVFPLAGCGTYTPDIQEFWGNSDQAVARENDLIRLARCETGIAIQRMFSGEGAPEYIPSPGHPVPKIDLSWLDTWGVQIALTLTVVENTAANPGVTANRVLNNAITPFRSGNVSTPQSFSMSVGATASSTATRTDTVHLFYKVSELHHAFFQKDDSGKYLPCPSSEGRATLFTENNFKVFEWLRSELILEYSTVGDFKNSSLGQQGQNGLSHEVKFEIVTSGSATPTWKLVDVSANSGNNPLVSAGRDRTQDIIITMGPLQDPKSKAPQLSASAQNLLLAQEIASFVQVLRTLPNVTP